MKYIHITKTVSTLLLTFAVSQSFAGGGTLAPEVDYKDVVHCQVASGTQSPIESLDYFVRSETQWGHTSKSPGLYLTGPGIEVTVYSDDNLHHIQNPTSTAETVILQQGEFLALGFNVRALQVIAKGSEVSLSMVAGATGDVKIQDLKLKCGN